MEILELNLKHFGKFTDYKLPLHAGINIISGGNETGKSTLHAFVRAMLYGITRNRSRALDEYQLRQPWENPNHFAGSMRLLYGEKIYRIERNFFRREESVQVICETDGTEIQDTQAMLHAFCAGLCESDFDNTVFIRQAQAATSTQLGEHLRDFLVNLEQTGDSNLDVSAAQEYLKKKRRGIEKQRSAALGSIEEEIAKKTQEIDFLRADLNRLVEKSREPEEMIPAMPGFERIKMEQEPAGGEASKSLQPERAASGTVPGSGDPAAERQLQTDFGKGLQTDMRTDPGPGPSEEESGGLLEIVLLLLAFTAAGLSAVCAFITTDSRMRYALGAAVALFAVLGLRMLLRVMHPQSRLQRAEKKAKREAFLDRHLGFRDDPDDPEVIERELKRSEELQRIAGEEALRGMSASWEEAEEQRERDLIRNAFQNREETQGDLSCSGNTIRIPDFRKAHARGRAEFLDREIAERREKTEALTKELEVLYGKKASVGGFDQELRAIDLASERIRELSGRIYHESGAQFSEHVSTLLAGLTEGRYSDIALDEKMNVRINTPDRLLRTEQVSFGTMNQIYFALRLAAGDLLTGSAGLPVFLDEPFAMYDDERLESALRYLSSSGRQVVLFTCQRRELDLLAKIRG